MIRVAKEADPVGSRVNSPSSPSSPTAAYPTAVPDAEGAAGDVQWNFEKWLLSPDGEPVARFRPRTEPDDPQVLAAVDGLGA